MSLAGVTALRMPGVEKDWSRASFSRGASATIVPTGGPQRATLFGGVSGRGAGAGAPIISVAPAGPIAVPPTEQAVRMSAGGPQAANYEYDPSSAAADGGAAAAGGSGYGPAGASADGDGGAVADGGSDGQQPQPSSAANELLEQVLSRSQVLPLRRDNERLMRQNNALHQQLIAEAESFDAKFKAHAEQHRKLSSEHADLKFIHTQHTRHKQSLEAELARAKRKLDSLLHDRATYQKESIDASTLVARGDGVPPPPVPASELKSSAVPLASVADARIAELERQVARFTAAEKQWTDREQAITQRMSAVNSENERLAHALVTERNWDRIQCAHELEANAALIKTLNQRLDFVNAERAGLANKMGHIEMAGGARASEALQRKEHEYADLRAQFDKTLSLAEALKRELNDTTEKWRAESQARERAEDGIARATQARASEFDALRDTYERTLQEADRLKTTVAQLRAAQDDEKARESGSATTINDLRTQLAVRDDQYQATKQQFEALVLATERTKADYEACKVELDASRKSSSDEASRLRAAVTQKINENGTLTAQVRQLMSTQTTLETERTKLADRVQLLSSNKLGSDEEKKVLSEQLHDAIELVKAEKQNAAALQTKFDEHERRLDDVKSELNSVRAERQAVTDELNAQKVITQHVEGKLHSAYGEISRQKGVIASLQDSAAQFNAEKKGVDEASAAARKMARDLAAAVSDRQKTEVDLSAAQDKLNAALSERDVLKQTLRSLDEQLTHINSNVRRMSDEKDALIQLNDELKAEAGARRATEQQLRQEITTYSQTITALKAERVTLTSAVADAEHASGTRNDAVARANTRLQTLKAEYDNQSAALEQANARLREAHEQHAHTKAELDTLNKQHAALAQELRDSTHTAQATSSVADTHRKQLDDLKSVVRQVDATRARAEEQLQTTLRQLTEHKELLKQTNADRAQVEQKLVKAQQDGAQLRQTLQALDAERDKLQSQLDAKSEHIAQLTTTTSSESRQKEAASLAVEQHKRQLALQHEQLTLRDKTVTTLQREVEHVTIEYRKLEEVLRVRMTENKNLTDDLANVARANQVCNKKLQEVVHDRDDRAQHLERSLTQLAYAEQLLKAKAREQNDLQSTYQACCAENERVKATARELDAERNEQRGVIRRVQEQCARFEAYAQTLTQEKDRLIIDLQSAERQNVDLQHSLATLSKTLDATNTTKETLLKDVSTARNVTLGLHHTRDELNRKCMELTHARDLLHQKMAQLQADNGALVSTLNTERNRYRDLEAICQRVRLEGNAKLAGADDKAAGAARVATQHQLRVAQLHSEKQSLQEQIASLLRFRDKQAAEISRFTTMLAATVALPNGGGGDDAGAAAAAAVGDVNVAPATRVARDKVLSTLHHRIGTLETQCAEAQRTITSLEADKAKLKQYLWKYESKVAEAELDRRMAVAAAAAATSPNASPALAAAEAAGASASAGVQSGGRISPLAGAGAAAAGSSASAAAAGGTSTTTTTTTTIVREHAQVAVRQREVLAAASSGGGSPTSPN